MCVHLEHYFKSKSLAAIRELFGNTYPDKEVRDKAAVHRLITKFRDTKGDYLWQVLVERQKNEIAAVPVSGSQSVCCKNVVSALVLSFCAWRGSCVKVRVTFWIEHSVWLTYLNRNGRLYCLDYTEIPKVFFTPHRYRWRQYVSSLINTARRTCGLLSHFLKINNRCNNSLFIYLYFI
jgi:hypothetical protein